MKTIVIVSAILFSSLLFAQDVQDEMKQLKSQVVASPDKSALLLVKINRLYHQTGKIEDALKYYNEIQQAYKGKELEAAAVTISVPYLIKAQQYDLVIRKCVYVKDNFKGSEWAANCLYNLGELYLNMYENEKVSTEYFKELILTCPKSSLVQAAQMYIGGK